ncbi:beta galactosidase jelly roll domain-containing protein [Sphingomonas sp. BT553]|uniref:Beta galactosidase jelly roll domain-containing protein n=2 Tax=Sphingomonas mollis TaxID=2795726 RepID=A0ABS0XN70_9SPHN|nr:beta galactosidase jelly roll domain-containing protein [Sphingomonas sp. BT553]
MRTMIPYRELLLVVSMLAASAVQAAPRDTVPLTADWRFRLGDQPADARAATFDDAGWSRVSLPHNWNRMGGTAERRADYQNVHGAGWYRRTFATPAKFGDRRAWIEIDAASIIADVWVNGVHLGRHAGAFARFRFDATAALKPAGDNILVIRVDNSSPRDPGSPTAEVPPMNGDWPMYGGLYRGVSLVVTDPVRVAMRDFGGPGIYARTLTADANRAEVSVTTRLENDRRRDAAVRVQAIVLDATGRTVATAATPATIAATGSGTTTRTIAVPTPHLWNGVADPYLYTLRVEIVGKDGRVLDRVEQPLGIRTFRIDPNTGFHLNGRALPLRGVSRHQDRPVKGWAIDAADIAEDMAIIRDIGANTLRLAHYQHADAAYAAADTAGLVTWAEIPLVDRSAPWASAATTPGFAANAEQQLRELIRQTYNHPSIAVWSIANEVNLEAAKGRGTSNARPLLERLQRVVHEEDPSRPATLADCCGSIPAEARAGLDTVAGITDVIGYNRYHGWYANDVNLLGPDLARLHALYPRQPISISEYGAGGALTQHSDDPRGGPIAAFGRPHPEEFQNYILEESWRQIAAVPFVWASWVWNMFDFSNELRLEGDLTDTNDKGLVTFDRRTKKDAYYFYKANWSADPFVHLTGSRHADRPYPLAEVKAYSNQPTMRLTLNGRAIGTATCALGICRWPNVALTPGDNRFEASGDGVADTMTWRFAGRANAYAIRAGTLTGATGKDGKRWGSDVFMTGGTGHFRDQPSASRGGQPGPVRPVAGTMDQAPYESWREGSFAYAIPVAHGRYRVKLHLFEPVADKRPGQRVFTVAAEGKAMGKPIDVVREAGGAMTALTRRFTVDVRDGMLDLGFAGQTGEALVSGIEVEPL